MRAHRFSSRLLGALRRRQADSVLMYLGRYLSTTMFINNVSIFIFGYSCFFFQGLFALYFNYTNNTTANIFLNLGFYFSMTVGSLIAMKWPTSERQVHLFHLVNGVIFSVSFLLLFWLPNFGAPALVLSLIGVGYAQSILFSSFPVRQVIINFSAGAFLYFVSAPVLFEYFGKQLVLVCTILPILFYLTVNRRVNLRYLSLVGIATLIVIQVFGAFSPPSWIERRTFNKFSPQKLEADYSPTFISEVINATGFHYIITNGSRFSRMYDRHVDSKYVINPLYDSPYIIQQPKKVLVIGSAGGINVFRAIANGVSEVYAVDINPAVHKFVSNQFRDVTMGLFQRPQVKQITAEGRSFIELTPERFDLIVVQGVQTGTLAALGANALMESFLSTNESIRAMLRILKPSGLIFLEEDSAWTTNEADLGISILKNLYYSLGSSGVVSSDTAALFSYTVAPYFPPLMNPNAFTREVLLIAKDGLGSTRTKIETSFKDFSIQWLDEKNQSPHLRLIADNQPYFVSQEFRDDNFVAPIVSVLLILVIAFGFFAIVRSSHVGRFEGAAMFFSGASYTLLIASLAGPMFLLAGNPTKALLLINAALLASSLLLALTNYYRLTRGFLITCFAYFIFLILVVVLKDKFLYPTLLIGDPLIRTAAALGAAIFCFLFLEAPYYAILNSSLVEEKRVLVFLGKLGAFGGIFIGILCQMRAGFLESMIACLAAYAICLTILMWVRFRKQTFPRDKNQIHGIEVAESNIGN